MEKLETTKQVTTKLSSDTSESLNTHTSQEAHHGPHIPLIQGETVYGPISTTVVTTFVFLLLTIVVSFFANRALKSQKKSRLKLFFLNYIHFFDGYLRESFGDKSFARRHFVLVVGIFSIVLFGNLLGLVIDWIGFAITPSLHYIMRPMHSDLNTTLVLALITVIMMLAIAVKTNGVFKMVKGYVFNFHGHSFLEKCIGVFEGWLHLISVFATVASLSLRLFGNIFAGVVLLGVITYLGGMATYSFSGSEFGKVLSLPFWFFEIGVALIQAIVFAGLMIAYFNSSKSSHH